MSRSVDHDADTPSPNSSSSEGGQLWDVQEILAERRSMGGEIELLVVWKTSWIPKENLMADGPVMRQFMESRKWNFGSAPGVITSIRRNRNVRDNCGFQCYFFGESRKSRKVAEVDVRVDTLGVLILDFGSKH